MDFSVKQAMTVIIILIVASVIVVATLQTSRSSKTNTADVSSGLLSSTKANITNDLLTLDRSTNKKLTYGSASMSYSYDSSTDTYTITTTAGESSADSWNSLSNTCLFQLPSFVLPYGKAADVTFKLYLPKSTTNLGYDINNSTKSGYASDYPYNSSNRDNVEKETFTIDGNSVRSYGPQGALSAGWHECKYHIENNSPYNTKHEDIYTTWDYVGIAVDANSSVTWKISKWKAHIGEAS